MTCSDELMQEYQEPCLAASKLAPILDQVTDNDIFEESLVIGVEPGM
jgi:hypothetical protein